MVLSCYGLEQGAKYGLSKRYGVTCKEEEFLSQATKAANLGILLDLDTCGAYNETISCFLKGKVVDPCAPTVLVDCDGLVVAFLDPDPKPCYLAIQFLTP